MNLLPDTHDDWDERQLAAEDRAAQRYRSRLSAHPHCADPDHPGCQFCDPEDESTTNESEE